MWQLREVREVGRLREGEGYPDSNYYDRGRLRLDYGERYDSMAKKETH